ncbi:MAG: hypothetical protein ABW321_13010 [Polyangiales bacterium]
MLKSWLVAGLFAFGACAAISGSQTFESVSELSLPIADGVSGTGTISAVGSENTQSFAEVLLEDLNDLRGEKFVDSVELAVQIQQVVLDADTTFAGVQAIRITLRSVAETISLCDRTLSAGDRAASRLTCEVDHALTESTLEQMRASDQDSELSVELDIDGEVTARRLTSTLHLEVQLDANASL